MNKIWNFLIKHSNKFVNGAILYYLTTKYIIDISILEGESMNPTFNNGDIVLVNKFIYYLRKPKINEIVSVISPLDSSLLCKRITGKEGNIKLFKMHFVKILKDFYWIEGDNKKNSLDSKNFGPINTKKIKGKVFMQLYPKIKWNI